MRMVGRGALIGSLVAAIIVGGLAGALGGGASVLDYALGLGLGALTMSGLASMISALGPGRRGRRQMLVVGLHLLKYPLILGILYVVLVTLHRGALPVMGGYTLALLVFLAYLGTAAPAAKPEADR